MRSLPIYRPSKPVRIGSAGRRAAAHRAASAAAVRISEGDRTTAGTEQLLSGEPAYMMVPGGTPVAAKRSSCYAPSSNICRKNSAAFWWWKFGPSPTLDTADFVGSNEWRGGNGQAARFEIVAPAVRIPRHTIEALCKSLGTRCVSIRRSARCHLGRMKNLAPPGLKPFCDCANAAIGIVLRWASWRGRRIAARRRRRSMRPRSIR